MDTILRPGTPQSSPAAPLAVAKQLFARTISAGLDAVLSWHQRARSRRHLSALDDRLLRDIGLDRAVIWQESQKPFWRD